MSARVSQKVHESQIRKTRKMYVTFLRSKLPKAQGTVNGKEIIALRDTGCTGVLFIGVLVSSYQSLRKESDAILIDESTQGIL